MSIKVRTKHFGEIDLDEGKVLIFENGIMGYENYKKFTILFINPVLVMEDYNPVVEEELLSGLGELNPDNQIVFVTLTVPKDLTRMTANLKAPIVINADTRKGCQVIVENHDYKVKYPVYERFAKAKQEKEGKTC